MAKKILLAITFILALAMTFALVSCGECEHVFEEWTTVTEATCTAEGSEKRTCELCSEEETSVFDIDPDAHAFGEWTTVTEATCTAEGSKERVCKCGEKEYEIIKAVGSHSFDSGVCTVCGEYDKNSDEYKYELLKKKADAIAFSCAETALREKLKVPSSMKVLGEQILDSDEYFRYYIKINYTASNSYGGAVEDNAYFLVRVSPTMDGTFFYFSSSSGIKYSITESTRTEWGWHTEPSDWSLDTADMYTNPDEVSLKLIIANPNKYAGKYVKIKEQLVISSNNISESYLRIMISTGDGQYNYNTDNFITVFYYFCDNMDDLIMLDADYQKITVCGEVKIYSDSPTPYIDAYEITIDKEF